MWCRKPHTPAWQRIIERKKPNTDWSRFLCRKGATALSSQLYFNITTETQSLVSLHLSASHRTCRLFAVESPCLPITSTLGPHRVKVVSISCRIHLLCCTLTDNILLSLKPFDKTKEVKRRGKEAGKYWRDRAGQWMREKEMGEWGGQLVLRCLSTSLKLGEKKALHSHFPHLAAFIAMCNGYKGPREATLKAGSAPFHFSVRTSVNAPMPALS